MLHDFKQYQQKNPKEGFELQEDNFKLNVDHVVFEHDVTIPIKSILSGTNSTKKVKFVMLSSGHNLFGEWA